jgi:hypothetical protein
MPKKICAKIFDIHRDPSQNSRRIGRFWPPVRIGNNWQRLPARRAVGVPQERWSVTDRCLRLLGLESEVSTI